MIKQWDYWVLGILPEKCEIESHYSLSNVYLEALDNMMMQPKS